MTAVSHFQLSNTLTVLARYARHGKLCLGGDSGPCNCGLTNALESAEQIKDALDRISTGTIDRQEAPL